MGSKIICHEGNFITVPEGTEFLMNINDIVIPYLFQNSPPNPIKIKAVKDFILHNNFVDSPIRIEGNLLKDGYSRYLVCKELGKEYIPVATNKVKSNNKLNKNKKHVNKIIVNKEKSEKVFDSYMNDVDCVVYTDASCNYSTKEYCSAYIVVKDREIIHSNFVKIKEEKHPDINIAEAQAIIEALKYAKESNMKMCICSDSLSAIQLAEGKIKKLDKKVNKEFYYSFIDFMNSMRDYYTLQKVKGHSYDWYNRCVDKLAKHGLKENVMSI